MAIVSIHVADCIAHIRMFMFSWMYNIMFFPYLMQGLLFLLQFLEECLLQGVIYSELFRPFEGRFQGPRLWSAGLNERHVTCSAEAWQDFKFILMVLNGKIIM